MRIKFERVTHYPSGYTTIGYWFWDEARNRGTLTIQVMKMDDWRHEVAVWGHEILEALYCWIMGIPTEDCDAFDDRYEQGYRRGTIPLTYEPGDDRRCPYFWGHWLGKCWEHVWVRASFCSWRKYLQECDRAMGI